MIISVLQKLYRRDLEKLKQEIMAYQREENLWIIDKNILNSGGNLCLHLVGNLNHFIGTILGETGYVRQRNLEFSSKNVPKTELVQQVEATRLMIEKVLNQLTERELAQEYPIIVFQEKMTTLFFLTHLSTHLSYHLGQINYHRRLLDVA